MKKFVLNGVELETVIYPNGEIDIKNTSSEISAIVGGNPIEVFWYNCNLQDLFVLAKLQGTVGDFDKLYIDYLPYQRSDRDFFDNCCGIDSLLDLSCGMVDSLLKENSVLIINDPHNEEAVKHYLPDAKFTYKCISQIMNTKLPNLLVYPDKNAYSKYSPLLEGTALNALDYVILEKERDTQTGKIIAHSVAVYKQGYMFGLYDTACIIDDICDYGGTFLSAKNLVERKVGYIPKWWLSVSHNTDCVKTDVEKAFTIL